MCFAVLLLYARDKFLALMSVTNREVDCRIGIVNKQTLIAGRLILEMLRRCNQLHESFSAQRDCINGLFAN